MDGRTDGGDCNIPNTFLKKRGDKNDPQKKHHLGTVSKNLYWRVETSFTALTSRLVQMWIKTHTVDVWFA